MIPFNYHHLYYFYVVAKEGSIAKATRSLLLAQPTISGQLRELEESLGRPLFERKRQRLHLTEEGRFVLDYAEKIFDLGRELSDSLKDRGPKGRFRAQIGLAAGTPRAIAQKLTEYMLDAYPGSHLTIREDDPTGLLLELNAHRLDLILSDSPLEADQEEGTISRLVARVPVSLAAAPSVAKKLSSFPKDLDKAPFILPAKPSRVAQQVLELFDRWKVRPEIVAEVQDVELACRLAAAGRGIVPLNRETLASFKPEGRLRPLQVKLPGVLESVHLIARQRRWLNPLAAAALDGFRL